MEQIQIFQNKEFGGIRTVKINGIIYFVGVDVCRALEYRRPNDAIRQHIDNEDTVKHRISDNQGFIHETLVVNESGMYALIFGSKLPAAKAFKRWVTSEILPALRNTGSYSLEEPKSQPLIKPRRTYTVTEIAAEVGITARDLNCELKEEGIQFFNGERWEVLNFLKNKDYVLTRYVRLGNDIDGSPLYRPFMVWTDKGRKLILETYDLDHLI